MPAPAFLHGLCLLKIGIDVSPAYVRMPLAALEESVAVLGCAPPLEVALHSMHEAFLASRWMVSCSHRSQSQVVPWLLKFGRTEVCEGLRTASQL